MSRSCTDCGHVVPEDAERCANCGYPVGVVEALQRGEAIADQPVASAERSTSAPPVVASENRTGAGPATSVWTVAGGIIIAAVLLFVVWRGIAFYRCRSACTGDCQSTAITREQVDACDLRLDYCRSVCPLLPDWF